VAVTPSGQQNREAKRFRRLSPIRLHGVLNGSSAAPGWSQGRICAGNGRRRVRFGYHELGIADEEAILRLWLARLALPASTALPPCVLSKTCESGAPNREVWGGHGTQGAARRKRGPAQTRPGSEAQGEEEHQCAGEGEGGDDRGYASDECQQEGPPGAAFVAGPVCRNGADDRHRHVHEAGDDGG
jgi:hypothetical protein